jgi:MFS family permease
MSTQPAAVRTKLSQAQWAALLLLVVSIFINYIDRSNLSIAVALPPPKGLSLDPARQGYLLSAFFATYALFQLLGIVGFVLDRVHVSWVYAIAFFVWSVATAATGLASGFAVLFALRLLLGVGESAAYPCYSKTFATYFPEHHRGLANGLIDAGSKFGPALGMLVGGLLMARFGWRPFFVVLGAASLIWLIPWLKWMPRGKGIVVEHAALAAHPPPGVLHILGQRSAWGSIGGLFCGNYYWYFLLTWLPSYMVKERQFSKEHMANMSALAFLAIGLSSALCGWLSDHWIAAGATPTRVRKTFTVGGLTLSTVILPVVIVDSKDISMALLFLACVFFGMWSSNHWALIQTLAGPPAAGKWTAVQNGFGNLAGVAAPALTGLVVKHTGQFFGAFAVATGFALAGAFFYMFVIGRIEQVDWRRG